MSEIQIKEEQLDLGVKISKFSTWRNKFNRKVRSISYSAPVILLKSIFFWVNTGVLVAFSLILYQYKDIFAYGKGILLPSGYFSHIPQFVSNSVIKFSVIPILFYSLIGIHIFLFVILTYFVKLGRSGIVNYIFVIELAAILLCGKLIIAPLFILGW